jgi:serine/threonine protein phosphatase PrpC
MDTSYIIALMGEGPNVTTLHAGDCRLGRLTNQGSIRWLTPVHTLANAIQDLDDQALRLAPDRHLLTRSFRGKRFQAPDCVIHEFDDRDRGLLIASDGFWADLPEDEQLALLQGGPTGRQTCPDDVSCLFWPLPKWDKGQGLLAAQRHIPGHGFGNLILASRETRA